MCRNRAKEHRPIALVANVPPRATDLPMERQLYPSRSAEFAFSRFARLHPTLNSQRYRAIQTITTASVDLASLQLRCQQNIGDKGSAAQTNVRKTSWLEIQMVLGQVVIHERESKRWHHREENGETPGAKDEHNGD